MPSSLTFFAASFASDALSLTFLLLSFTLSFPAFAASFASCALGAPGIFLTSSGIGTLHTDEPTPSLPKSSELPSAASATDSPWIWIGGVNLTTDFQLVAGLRM